ncbi:MAG: winged helix DNA-binding domain-containing protein [Bacteroidia bacterium]|nr:winged helix DNA-binding domain-containing protein [Bacteroidia bacterium]
MADKLTQISHIRLASQQITTQLGRDISETIAWMGAIQAQDYPMAKWAMGVRLPGTTDMEIESAISAGLVIRTHVMRPTWHLVSPDDIYWMLRLTGPRIKALMKGRHVELELTEKLMGKCYDLLEKHLEGENHLTREEVITLFEKEGISTGNGRFSHIMALAEIDMKVCSGKVKHKKQTYALLPERVPVMQILTEDESLEKLARKYFFSHGPATLEDFVWWSGLTKTAARRAWEMIRPDLEVIKNDDGQEYSFLPRFSAFSDSVESLFLLPAFDEYYISYTDRRAVLSSENYKKAVSDNGVFRPIIVIDGQIKGLWTRTAKKDHLQVEARFFESPDPAISLQLEKAAAHYGRFLGFEKVQIKF